MSSSFSNPVLKWIVKIQCIWSFLLFVLFDYGVKFFLPFLFLVHRRNVELAVTSKTAGELFRALNGFLKNENELQLLTSLKRLKLLTNLTIYWHVKIKKDHNNLAKFWTMKGLERHVCLWQRKNIVWRRTELIQIVKSIILKSLMTVGLLTCEMTVRALSPSYCKACARFLAEYVAWMAESRSTRKHCCGWVIISFAKFSAWPSAENRLNKLIKTTP